MEVRDPVREPDVRMKVGDRRTSGRARVPVRRGDRDRLVRREDDADVGMLERGVEERRLGAPGTGEDEIDAPVAEDLEHPVRRCALHVVLLAERVAGKRRAGI
jgi:hypothetical protein